MIFVSYSSVDAEEAVELVRVLEDAGISCWQDTRHLTAGQRVVSGLMEAIDSSSSMVAIIGANGLGAYQELEISQGVSRERVFASSYLFVPVFLVPPLQVDAELAWIASSYSGIILTGERREEGYRHLLKSLLRPFDAERIFPADFRRIPLAEFRSLVTNVGSVLGGEDQQVTHSSPQNPGPQRQILSASMEFEGTVTQCVIEADGQSAKVCFAPLPELNKLEPNELNRNGLALTTATLDVKEPQTADELWELLVPYLGKNTDLFSRILLKLVVLNDGVRLVFLLVGLPLFLLGVLPLADGEGPVVSKVLAGGGFIAVSLLHGKAVRFLAGKRIGLKII